LSPSDLRATNAVALVILGYLALLCRHEIELLLTPNKRITAGDPTRQRVSSYSLHSALNICLFPLLFFFSGLYYTDVISTAAVLASFLNHLRRVRASAEGQASTFTNDAVTFLLGVVTLFMRQTNVFWTVVFMGGLEAIQAVKTLSPKPADAASGSDGTPLGNAKFYFWRSSLGDVHDVPLSEAWVEGISPKMSD
jgi:alpha-1,2-glucosyltransferase